MTANDLDFVLDGDAAAEGHQEIFVAEVTTADVQCDACGSVGAVGTLPFYAAPMGIAVRCATCTAILLRAVNTPHGRWLDMRGAHSLRFTLTGAAEV